MKVICRAGSSNRLKVAVSASQVLTSLLANMKKIRLLPNSKSEFKTMLSSLIPDAEQLLPGHKVESKAGYSGGHIVKAVKFSPGNA